MYSPEMIAFASLNCIARQTVLTLSNSANTLVCSSFFCCDFSAVVTADPLPLPPPSPCFKSCPSRLQPSPSITCLLLGNSWLEAAILGHLLYGWHVCGCLVFGIQPSLLMLATTFRLVCWRTVAHFSLLNGLLRIDHKLRKYC